MRCKLLGHKIKEYRQISFTDGEVIYAWYKTVKQCKRCGINWTWQSTFPVNVKRIEVLK